MADRLRRDWSLLPDDVIHLIVNRIKSIEDLMVMSSVCRSWRFVTVKHYLTQRVQLPWMMTKGFFSIDRNRYYNILFPYLQHSRYWGSKFGLLVVLTFKRQFHLLNPITRAHLDLPPKPIFKDEIDHDDRYNNANSVPGFVRKALLFRDGVSSSANENKYILVVIGSVSGNLAFARPGMKLWIHVKSPFGRVISAVWFHNKMLFMLGSGVLMCYEKDDSGNYVVNQFAPRIEWLDDWNDAGLGVDIWNSIGLVLSFGDLFMVVRTYGDSKNWYKTRSFVVYKLDFENKEWTETKDLGDGALFVDADDNVMALNALDVHNCRSNCIYFVEKHWDKHGRYLGSYDVGVCNLKDGIIEPHFIRDPNTSSILQQNPVWLMPSLC